MVLDLETTGLNPRTDKIIEIGALLVEDGEILDTFSTFVSPGRKLLPQTTEITGITDEMLEHAPVFADIAEKLLAFLGEHVLLGHSIISDYAFLKKALVNEQPKGFAFERNGLDTLKIARRFLPAEQKKALSALTAYFQIPHEPHRALADAQATFYYMKSCGIFMKRGRLRLLYPFRCIIRSKEKCLSCQSRSSRSGASWRNGESPATEIFHSLPKTRRAVWRTRSEAAL